MCHKPFKTRNGMLRCMVKHDISEGFHECRTCHKKFNTMRDLEKHICQLGRQEYHTNNCKYFFNIEIKYYMQGRQEGDFRAVSGKEMTTLPKFNFSSLRKMCFDKLLEYQLPFWVHN